MYSRRADDQLFTFEPSGGLLNASLVMMDRETDSHWSIISDEAIHGRASGTTLRQLPGSVKATFGEWKALHPATKVLSVKGVEHDPKNPYDRYFDAAEGFRGLTAADDRLEDKADVFGLHLDGKPWAIAHTEFENGGAVVTVGERRLFVYRLADDALYRSTVAFLLPAGDRAEQGENGWQLHRGDETIAFDADRRFFIGEPLEQVSGFDTFWYIWSLTNKKTGLVAGSS